MTDADELSAVDRTAATGFRGDRSPTRSPSMPSMRSSGLDRQRARELVPSARSCAAHRRPGGPAPAGRRRAGPAHRAVLVRRIGRRTRGGGRARGIPAAGETGGGAGRPGPIGGRGARTTSRAAWQRAAGGAARRSTGAGRDGGRDRSSSHPVRRCAAKARTGR